MNIDDDDKQVSETVKKEIQALLSVIKDHQQDMTRAVESLQQAANGKVGIIQFKDLKKALNGFSTARKSVEIAKRLVKNWALEELKED